MWAIFDRLCSEGILVPSELNLLGGEVRWAERMGFPDPVCVAVDHARLGVLNATAHDVFQSRMLFSPAERLQC